MTIRELDISARSKSCLMSAGYKEVEDLRDVSDEALLAIKNLNQTCVTEIRNALEDYFYASTVEGPYWDGPDDGPTGKPYDIMEWNIEDLEMRVCTSNALKRAGINTVEDLCDRTLEDMKYVRNMGRRSLEELLTKMQELGLQFKDNSGIEYGTNANDIGSIEDNSKSKLFDIMERKIEDSGMSERTCNYLKSVGINRLGDLYNKSPEDGNWSRNMSRKTLEEILTKLKELSCLGIISTKLPICHTESATDSIDLGTLIKNLDFRPRVKRYFYRCGIDIIRDLCCMTEKQFDEIEYSYLLCYKSEIMIQMGKLGVSFKPEGESYLYMYPESVKKIANEHKDLWEYRLFIEVAILNYNWIVQYRNQTPELWEDDNAIEDIFSERMLADLLLNKIDEVKTYAKLLDDCIQKDIKEAFGAPGQPGNAQQIIEATEKLMGIYRSIIKSRLSFRLISADVKYRIVIENMCDIYEQLCKCIDELHTKMLVAKKQINDLITGKIPNERLTLDLNVSLEIDMSTVINSYKDLYVENDDDN